MNNEINTLEDLYKLLLPALKSKKRELHDLKYFYITEKDIWNYYKDNVWVNTRDLTLHDMVNDILNSDSDTLCAYVASNIDYERNEYED